MKNLLAMTLVAVLGTACGGKSKPAPAPEPKPAVVEEPKQEEPPPGPAAAEQAQIAEHAARTQHYESGTKI